MAWLREQGFEVADSDANFVLFGRFADRQALWQGLLDRGVLIRETGPEGWLRVSIGTAGGDGGVQGRAALQARKEIDTMSQRQRSARIERQTKESKVLVELDLDGSGRVDVSTGVGFYDHMLTAFGRHALFDLTVQTEGDTHIDAHHTVEDTAIVLGDALREALGDKAGIRRFGDSLVPLDEALVQCAVDVCGRPYCVHVGEPEGQEFVTIGDAYLGSLTRHVLETLAHHAQIALHVRVLSGRDPHHLVEAQFKAVARALRDAVAARPARDRRAVHQGLALTMPVGHRPRLRLRQPPLGRARPRAGRGRGDAVRRPRRRDGRRRARRAGRRRVRGVHARAAARARARGHRPPARRRPAGARHLRRHAGALRARGRARRRDARAAASGPASWSGCRRPSYRTWGGTPSTCPTARRLFAGIEDERFYFVHSYGVRDWMLTTNDRTRPPLVTWAEHGGDRFVAAVENGPLCATQFHPEKSGDAGAALLRNWVASLAGRHEPSTGSGTRLELLPAVDIAGGQAVQLVQGVAGSEKRFGDPVEAALRWQRAGAEWIHLVDLDAAFGRGHNRELLARIIGDPRHRRRDERRHPRRRVPGGGDGGRVPAGQHRHRGARAARVVRGGDRLAR